MCIRDRSLDGFQNIVKYIEGNISPKVTFESYDNICRKVANRIDVYKRQTLRPPMSCMPCSNGTCKTVHYSLPKSGKSVRMEEIRRLGGELDDLSLIHIY